MLQLNGPLRHVLVDDRVPHAQEAVPFVSDGVGPVNLRPVCLQEVQTEGVRVDAARRPHGDGVGDVPGLDVGDRRSDEV